MRQFNLLLTPDFLEDLKILMKRKGLKQKAEAIRMAVKEMAKRLTQARRTTDFRSWLGAGLKAPQRSKLVFKSEEDLWK